MSPNTSGVTTTDAEPTLVVTPDDGATPDDSATAYDVDVAETGTTTNKTQPEAAEAATSNTVDLRRLKPTQHHNKPKSRPAPKPTSPFGQPQPTLIPHRTPAATHWTRAIICLAVMTAGVALTTTAATGLPDISFSALRAHAANNANPPVDAVRKNPEDLWPTGLTVGDADLSAADEAALRNAELRLRKECLAPELQPPKGHDKVWTKRDIMLSREADTAARFGTFGEPYAQHNVEARTALDRASVERYNTARHLNTAEAPATSTYFEQYEGERNASDQKHLNGRTMYLAESGCRKSTRETLYGDFKTSERQQNHAWEARQELLTPITKNPQYQATRVAWQECMTTYSYPKTTMQSFGLMQHKWAARTNEDEQRDMLQTSLNCQNKVGAQRVVQELIDAQLAAKPELAKHLITWRDQQQAALAKVQQQAN